MNFQPTIRIGAVNYLNAKPLVYGLDRTAADVEIVFDYPSRLADSLAGGRLDVALIPSIEIFSNPDYAIVSDACIACFGPVLSVKLLCRVPPAEIGTLALDEGSRTSAAAARILLNREFGLTPRVEPLPVGVTPDETDADAVLLIGDRAIRAGGEGFREIRDVGRWWCDWAGLPLVFAAWTARPGADLDRLEAILTGARDAGVEHLEELARAEAPLLRLDEQVCRDYLRNNIRFHFGKGERRGLEFFYDQAVALGLAAAGVDLDLEHCGTAR